MINARDPQNDPDVTTRKLSPAECEFLIVAAEYLELEREWNHVSESEPDIETDEADDDFYFESENLDIAGTL